MNNEIDNLPEDQRNWYIDIYNGNTTPENWLYVAKKLKMTVDILTAAWEEEQNEWADSWDGVPQVIMTHQLKHIPSLMESFDAVEMLMAYSLENILKGLITKRLNGNIMVNGKLDNRITTHSLVELSQTAGIRLDDYDNILLNRLQHTSVWAGRYPTPKKPNDLVKRDMANEQKTKTGSSLPRGPLPYYRRYCAIYERALVIYSQ